MATDDSADDGLTVIETNNDAFYLDPNRAFAGPGTRPPLARSEYGTEILSYALVHEAFRDGRLAPRNLEYFRRIGASPLVLELIREGNLNFMATEKHDRIRPIMASAFSPRRIEAFRPEMRRIANAMTDAFIARGQCDLVADFAHMYPISVLAQFMGVPEAHVPSLAEATVEMRMLGQVPFAPGLPRLEAALRFLLGYVEDLVSRRRKDPSDGLVDALIAMQSAGEKLSEKELLWGVVFLLLAGHDTTRYTLSGSIHAILSAGLWETLAGSPERIPDAIAESMRICPGTPRQMRVVDEPFELASHHFEKGEVVSLNLNAAGRDPDTFDEVNRFRCGRDDPAYDIGFGYGRHFCIGHALAKTEMAEAIAVLTQRLTRVEIATPCALKPTGVIGGYDSLPVRFEWRRESAGPSVTAE